MMTDLSTRGRRVAATFGLGAAMALASAGPALGDARGSASCMGFEASGISPAGSSAEFPGGPAQLRRWIGDAFPGLPPGAIYRTVARLHEGSHAACDEILD